MCAAAVSTPEAGNGKLRISVVIATRNRAPQLARALESLAEQSIPADALEVIVVDNGSNDNTQEVALGFAARLPNLQVLREAKPGAAAARNTGIRASRSRLLLFLDDDVVADRDLIEQHLRRPQTQPQAALLGSVRFPWKGDETPLLLCLTRHPELLQSFTFADVNRVPFQHFYTCNLSMPKAFFLQQAGFDEGFTSYGFEDPELGFRFVRAGFSIVFVLEASVLHDVRVNFSEFCRKRYSSGRWARYLLWKYPEMQPVVLAGSRWRQRVSDAVGLFATPLAPLFDRKPGWLGRRLLPLLGFFCWHHLQYCFRRGFLQAHPPALAGTEPAQ